MTRRPLLRAAVWLAVLGVGLTATTKGSSAREAAPDAGSAPSRGPACRATYGLCGRVFIVAIGHNGTMELDSVHYAAVTAESDARFVATRLVLEALRVNARIEPRTDSLRLMDSLLVEAEERFRSDTSTAGSGARAVVLTGDNATRENIRSVFAQIARIGRPQDALVVFYAGISRGVGGNAGERQEYLALAGERALGDSAAFRFGVSAQEFGSWLSGLSIDRQLVVTEAGMGSSFLDDFAAGLVERNEFAQQLVQRHRILLAPRNYGLETRDGGPLAIAIRRTPVPLLGIWSRTHATVAALDEIAVSAAMNAGEYVGVFDERSFIGVSRRLAARTASQTRGVVTEAAAQPAEPSVIGGRNIALLIGTDRYEGSGWSQLRNPIHDVTQVASELAGGFGFDTLVLRNPTRNQVLETIIELVGRTYGDDDQVLVFIAGHGHYDASLKMGHLVATDSRALSTDRLRDSYISHGHLAQYLDAIPAKHVLTVIDACFGGAFAGGGARSNDEYDDTRLSDFVREKLKPKSRLYITSGGTEYVPDGRPGQHSPFARRFIATLRDARASARLLTIANLYSGVEPAQPGPLFGDFGSNEPGGDFLLIPASRLTRR